MNWLGKHSIYIKKYVFIVLAIIASFCFLFKKGEAMVDIDKNIVKADLSIKFLKLEKEDKKKESLPLESEQGNFDDPWIQGKVKNILKQYSMERKIRIDFKLKNVYLQNPITDKDGKYAYRLFSVRWPIFSMEIINKKLKKGMYQTYAWITSKNSKILVEGEGYHFLRNELVSDWFGNGTPFKEKHETTDLIIKILDQKQTLESVLITGKPFLTDRPYNIEGYCVYGGSIITANMGWFWYPFDKYSLKLFINFPFKETDFNLSIEKTDEFETKISIPDKKELENFKISENKDQLVEILLSRKNYKTFVGIFISVLIALLPTFFPALETKALARIFKYIAVIVTIFFSTMPPQNIAWVYPFRFILFLATSIYIAVNEYLHWLRNFILK